jgi:peptidoglycan/xylan/chitin deacetylase (PgdA/CDA1 family)
VAATVVAVVISVYGAGHLLGRVTGPVAATRSAAELASQPDSGETVAGTPVPSPPAQPPAQPPPAQPVAVNQPVTGPGRPPLPMTGTGPHGTLRTTGERYVALTFDDGPDPRWTPQVLELLDRHDTKATFCVVGQLAEAYPGLVRRIAAAGHTLCNHSWDHDVALGGRPPGQIRADLRRTTAAIQRAAPGIRVSYYRQPGGAWTQRVVRVAAELGMSSLHWAVDPQDWSRPGAGAIADAIATGTAAGGIVLLHDGGGERHGTVRALGRVLPRLAGRLPVDALPPGVDPPRLHGRELPLKPGQI